MRGTSINRHGFTLIELTVSLAVMSVLLLGLSSALVISSRSLEQAGPEVVDTLVAHEVLNRINADLRFALEFTEQTSTAVTFTVPDRTGDDTPETIRYAWSGTPGDPLTMTLNDGTAVEVAPDIRTLSFEFQVENIAGSQGGGGGDGTGDGEGGGNGGGGDDPPEVLIMDFSNPSGSFNDEVAEYAQKFIAQYFKPGLPLDATEWSITRIKFLAKHDGKPTGNLRVEVHTADGSQRPSGTVLTSTVVPKHTLGSDYIWAEATLPPIGGLDPSSGYCFVIRNEADAPDPTKFALTSPGSNGIAIGMVTDDGGSSWGTYPNQDFQFYVYGTVTTP